MIRTTQQNKIYCLQNGQVTAVKYPDDCVRLFHHDDTGHVDKLFEMRWHLGQAICSIFFRDEKGDWLVGWDHPAKSSIYEFRTTSIQDLEINAEGIMKVSYLDGSVFRSTAYELERTA